MVYAPDFVINAGGLINVAAERAPGGYNEAGVLAKVRNIARTLRRVLDTAQRRDISTQRAALQLAERKLAQQCLSPTAYAEGPYPLQRVDAS
jgi:leucine dehydrogenase